MRHALGQALQDFEGAMVLVSHDRHLLRITCDRLWLVYGGRAEPFNDDLEAYPAWLTAQRREQGSDGNSRSEGEHTAEARRARKRAEAERRRQLQPLKRQMTKLEQEMERLQASQSILESSLADTGFYQEDRIV